MTMPTTTRPPSPRRSLEPRRYRLALAALFVVAVAGASAGVGAGDDLSAGVVEAFRPNSMATVDRQVTVFGIVASTQRTTVDPKLDPIAAQLRKLRPGHGFRLRAVTSEQLMAGDVSKTDLGDGLEARVTLVEPETTTGKLRLEFVLRRQGKAEYRTTVTTPPNQLFFCEKPLPGGERLLIGVGAR